MEQRIQLCRAGLVLLVLVCLATACGGTPPRVETPTSPGIPTPTTKPSLQAPEGTLYQDDFNDLGSGWPVETGANFKVGYHPPDVYHVEVSAANSRKQVYAPAPAFDNATVETEVRVDHTATSTGEFWYGLALRGSGDQYYAFLISARSSKWQIVRSALDEYHSLDSGSDPAIEGMAGKNRLRVDADGSDFTFYINNQAVSHVNDSGYASGKVGFVVATQDETLAHIHYESLAVRKLQRGDAVLFRDDFTDTNSGWQTELGNQYRVGYHPPDVYHVEVSAPNFRRKTFRAGLSFTDFTLETRVHVDHTGTKTGDFGYGLAFRGDQEQYYGFTISARAKKWKVFKNSAGGSQDITGGDDSSIQGLTGWDMLRVDARGSDLSFYVNGHQVYHFSDSDYKSGKIGFVVETFGDETLAHIHYDWIEVRTVSPSARPSKTPAATEHTPPPTTVDATLTPTLTETSEPSATTPPTSTDTPHPSPTTCLDNSVFIADVTIPPGATLAPGAKFVKRWKLQNTGTCTWTKSYRFGFVSGDRIGGVQSFPLTEVKAPGDLGEIFVNLVAPTAPGTYTGKWSLINPAGQFFGAVVTAQIVVQVTPTSVASATPTVPSAAGILYRDDFSNKNSGWPTESGDEFAAGYDTQGAYRLQAKVANFRNTVLYPRMQFTDFSLEVLARVQDTATSNGDFGYGLAFRGRDNNFYGFTVSARAKKFSFFRNSDSGSEDLKIGDSNSIRGLSDWDKLRVEVKGSAFSFYINDQFVYQAREVEYKTGQIGLVVESFDEPFVSVRFDSLVVKSLGP